MSSWILNILSIFWSNLAMTKVLADCSGFLEMSVLFSTANLFPESSLLLETSVLKNLNLRNLPSFVRSSTADLPRCPSWECSERFLSSEFHLLEFSSSCFLNLNLPIWFRKKWLVSMWFLDPFSQIFISFLLRRLMSFSRSSRSRFRISSFSVPSSAILSLFILFFARCIAEYFAASMMVKIFSIFLILSTSSFAPFSFWISSRSFASSSAIFFFASSGSVALSLWRSPFSLLISAFSLLMSSSYWTSSCLACFSTSSMMCRTELGDRPIASSILDMAKLARSVSWSFLYASANSGLTKTKQKKLILISSLLDGE